MNARSGPLRRVKALQLLEHPATRLRLLGVPAGYVAADEIFLPLDLGLLEFVAPGLLLEAPLALDEERVVVALEAVELAISQLHNLTREAVQEHPVVAHDHVRALILLQEALEPLDGVEIEMVGGLVEEEQVGVPQQHSRQHRAALLSAAEFDQGPIQIVLAEVESLQHLLDPGIERVSALAFQPFLQAGVVFEKGFGFRIAFLQSAQSARRLVVLRLEILEVLKTARRFLAQGAPIVDAHFLLHRRDHRASAPPHRTAVRIHLPGENAEERGLARAVATDQRDAVPFADLPVDVFEQLLGTEALEDLAELSDQHGGAGRSRAGKRTENVVPRPRSLATSMEPRC